MRDIIKDYGKSETEKRERGVLDEYAEMSGREKIMKIFQMKI